MCSRALSTSGRILALLATTALAAPASAATTVNTFSGTVVANGAGGDVTTNDFGGIFGGGSLIGDAFTLTTTTDATAPSYFNSGDAGLGAPFSSPNLVTSSLTINGVTFNWVETSPQGLLSIGYTAAFTGFDMGLQNFYTVSHTNQSGLQSWYFDITPNVSTPSDWSTPLPSMSLAAGDFVNNGAAFYCYAYQTCQDPVSGQYETLALNITDVNDQVATTSATPLPAGLPLFATGLGGLGLLGWRRKRKAQAIA